MNAMTLGDFRTTVDVRGEGDPILFISGAGDDYHAWDLVRPGLPNHTTISFDNRDVGTGPRGPERYTTADMARDAVEVLDSLCVVKAHIVGHSLGSFVAQEIALQAPHRVESLTLIGSMARPDPYLEGLARLWQRWAIHLSPEDFALGGIYSWFGPDFIAGAGPETLVGEIAPALRDQGPGAFIRQIEAAMAHDTLSRLGEIAVPTLVVVGEQDNCTPAKFSIELAAAIPKARLVTIPGSGHSPTVEAPEALQDILRGFLRSSVRIPVASVKGPSGPP